TRPRADAVALEAAAEQAGLSVERVRVLGPLDDRLAQLRWQGAFGPPLGPGPGPRGRAPPGRVDAHGDPGGPRGEPLAWTRAHRTAVDLVTCLQERRSITASNLDEPPEHR